VLFAGELEALLEELVVPLPEPLFAALLPFVEPLVLGVFDSPSVALFFSPSVVLFLLEDDEYKSAYQPPPLRMKLPPLIWRLAVGFWHFGQVNVGDSEIFWISSHWFEQSAQAYS
jgi:hypothetical protein